MLSKNVNNKKYAPNFVFFNKTQNQKDSDDFWRRKLTLKVRFWHFLTPSLNKIQWFHLTSWVLAKNLSNLVSLPWKLYNRYCHRLFSIGCIINLSLSTKQKILFENSYILWMMYLPKHDLRPILTCRTRNFATQQLSATTHNLLFWWSQLATATLLHIEVPNLEF